MRSRLWIVLGAFVIMGCEGGPDESGKAQQASHPEVSLPGSNFEIDTNANLKVDDPAPSLDWANVTEDRQADLPSGSGDDSFGQGASEDTPVPAVVDGSIPPNKSDLLNFGVYLEETTTGAKFLHMFWHRVQEPVGTTNMDFEFNQSETLSANGVTPVRTGGDLLIQYDLSQGGTNPQLFLSRWLPAGTTGVAKNLCEANNSFPCWSTKVDLTASGDATGSINTSSILAADSDGLGNVSPRTFGEASVDFDAIVPPGTCTSFGSAYLKSRSSDSFTSALKDFIAPVPTSITNCGQVSIHKQDDLGNPLADAVFTLFTDNPPLNGPPPHGAEDVATAYTCTTNAAGDCTISAVFFGQYWVVETTTPAGYVTAPDQNIILSDDNASISLTFIDPRERGAIKVTKTRKHAASGAGDHPHAGVDFTVNGVTKTTDANGVACFDNLLPGTYAVHETVPAGYQGEADKNVTVDNAASCADAVYVGETVSFSNTPLSDLACTFTSQVTGGTTATIQCTGEAAAQSLPSGTPHTLEDLVPGTYTCTIVIDP